VNAFVWTMAKNVARDWARQEVRRAAAHAALLVLEDPFNHGRLDNDLQVRQELSALYRSYRLLPRRLREVSRLRKVDGLSQREIATRLGISESTVESYVRDAMDEVERKLTTELDVEERRSVFTWLRRRMSHD
jgi:RNA polymerase sigma factor (sigma-70 family)